MTFPTRARAVVFTALVAGAAFSSLSAARTPKVIPVTIEGIAFSPPLIKATVGDTVEWTNKDVVDHTSTNRQSAWDLTIGAGKKARVVLKKAGTVEYYCRFHPNMTGKIVVAPK